MNMMLPDSDTR